MIYARPLTEDYMALREALKADSPKPAVVVRNSERRGMSEADAAIYCDALAKRIQDYLGPKA